jgi:hypothetical protein
MLATIPRAPPIGSKALLPDRSFIGWFRRYNPEARKEIIIHKVKENETLKQLRVALSKFRTIVAYGSDYLRAVSLVQRIKCSSNDVTSFSISLAEFQDEKSFSNRAGLFLSALINESKAKNFTIITEHLEQRINLLGFNNRKNIIIQGDAGNWVGSGMKAGTITVQGNTEDWVGAHMEDGTILLQGNTEDWAGIQMEGGTITVQGNVRYNTGESMEGGTIYIEGKYGSLSYYDIKGGNIYHKRKLIVKDGEKV